MGLRIICSKCKQRTIQSDAYAVWDEAAQAFVLQAVLNFTSCSNCGAENSGQEEPIPPSEMLELVARKKT